MKRRVTIALTCFAAAVSVTTAFAWGGGSHYVPYTSKCGTQHRDCWYNSTGCGGTVTDTTSTGTACAPATAGSCTEKACVPTAPRTLPCC